MRRMRAIGSGILGLGLVILVVGIVLQATVPDPLPFPSGPADPMTYEETTRSGDGWFESVVRANEARRSATEITYAGFFLALLGGFTIAATGATVRRWWMPPLPGATTALSPGPAPDRTVIGPSTGSP